MSNTYIPLVEIAELVVSVIAVVLCLLVPRLNLPWARAASQFIARAAANPTVCVLSPALFTLAARAALLPVIGIPEPSAHDEFSYLLMGDTFASGRLANPAHPLWVHFESFHIIQQPTYASKYPAAQGLILAAGQFLFGRPWLGVWLSAALMCSAITWMLRACVPPKWALLGGLLVALRIGIQSYWMNSYWGGAAAAIGGALLFGAFSRLLREHRARHSLPLAAGLAILANSRPYEGLLVSLPVLLLLTRWLLVNGRTGLYKRAQIIAPGMALLAVTAAVMGWYNRRTTGDFFVSPYRIHEERYAVAPPFFWQKTRSTPFYNHWVMEDFWTGFALDEHKRYTSGNAFVIQTVKKVVILWDFFLGPLLTLPFLVALLAGTRKRRTKLAVWTLGLLCAGLLLPNGIAPHYFAPGTALIIFLVLQGLRQMSIWEWRGRNAGGIAPALILSLAACFCVARLAWPSHLYVGAGLREEFRVKRAQVTSRLDTEPGQHMVIVRYGPQHSPHDEWVYNKADIDGSRIVWAREMDQVRNCRLLSYFRNRREWLLEPDENPPKLSPYPAGCEAGSLGQ